MGKKPNEEPKLEELSSDELTEVQGGATFKATRSTKKKLAAGGSLWPTEWKVSEMDGKSNN